jgi:hypothetical protein
MSCLLALFLVDFTTLILVQYRQRFNNINQLMRGVGEPEMVELGDAWFDESFMLINVWVGSLECDLGSPLSSYVNCLPDLFGNKLSNTKWNQHC